MPLHHPLSSCLSGTLALLLAGPVAAQDLGGMFKRAVERTRQTVERKVEDIVVETVTRPAEDALDGDARQDDAPATRTPAQGGALPRADVLLGNVPQERTWEGAYGRKFGPAGNMPEFILANPYLSPENIFFGDIKGMRCTADGGLVVAGDAGFAAGSGNLMGTGYWRVAPDGAITPLLSRPHTHRSARESAGNGLPWAGSGLPADRRFSLDASGRLLIGAGDGVFRVGDDGRLQRVTATRFDQPGRPVEDGEGHVWVAHQTDNKFCTVSRIAPDGQTRTVLGPGRLCPAQPSMEEMIVPQHMAWDAANGEMVVAGSRIQSRPSHDMYTSIWRVRPDGDARRVLRTVKAGRSPIDQNLDDIQSLALDGLGRIHVGTRFIGDAHVRSATRQVMRLDEASGRLVPVTGAAYRGNARPGREDYSLDGRVANSNFWKVDDQCFGPDGTLFVMDGQYVIRRIDNDGMVRTWAY